jgi:hypothetical protein
MIHESRLAWPLLPTRRHRLNGWKDVGALDNRLPSRDLCDYSFCMANLKEILRYEAYTTRNDYRSDAYRPPNR